MSYDSFKALFIHRVDYPRVVAQTELQFRFLTFTFSFYYDQRLWNQQRSESNKER